LAAHAYDADWREQLSAARAEVMALASLEPGERVLDVACGTGLVTLHAACAVGDHGMAVGIDLSAEMVRIARQRALAAQVTNVCFEHMGAETLDLPDASFDVALCALGLMYMPDPARAVLEMLRVLRPGGRLVFRCGASPRAAAGLPSWPSSTPRSPASCAPCSSVLGREHALARLCADAKLDVVAHRRIEATLHFVDADAACHAVFVGGPVALAWSRFSADAKVRARARYLHAITPWRHGVGYAMPGEFVFVAAAFASHGRG
jgi:SAM-dependent methyltransferase